MPAVDFVATTVWNNTPIVVTAGRIIKVLLLNADGSQVSVLSEQKVPAGMTFTGNYTISGALSTP